MLPEFPSVLLEFTSVLPSMLPLLESTEPVLPLPHPVPLPQPVPLMSLPHPVPLPLMALNQPAGGVDQKGINNDFMGGRGRIAPRLALREPKMMGAHARPQLTSSLNTYLAIRSIHLEDDVADRIQDLTVILGVHLQDNFKLDFKFRKKELVTVESEGRQMKKY